MEWVSVEDRLPDDMTKVLVRYHNGAIDTAYHTNGIFRDTCCSSRFYMVTHWMPLPAPPTL